MGYYISETAAKGDSGKKIAVDDTILVKDIPCTAGSHMLESFKPLFSAEAVERLEKAGYEISGKTNVGEFGLDLVGETSYYAPCEKDGKPVGAAAALVAEGSVKAALCVDLNGAPRRAAAQSCVDFIKPTYSAVSRYGVIPCACSGETIGVAAANVEDAAEVLSVIAGHDAKDGTSDLQNKFIYKTDSSVDGAKIAIVKELYDLADEKVKAWIDVYADKLKRLGAKVETVSLPCVNDAQTAWQILLAAETCNNVSRYDGVKFGYRTPNYKNIDELYINSRTEGFGFLTKATVIYGSDVLSKGRYESCYDKALRIRRFVSNKTKEILDKFDAILAPACSCASYDKYDELDGFKKVYSESVFTAIPNIAGFPAIATCGVQLIGDEFEENTILSIAGAVEKMEA